MDTSKFWNILGGAVIGVVALLLGLIFNSLHVRVEDQAKDISSLRERVAVLEQITKKMADGLPGDGEVPLSPDKD